jgi:hypothetical protein
MRPHPPKHDIFVFGSNQKGYHGAGAAKYAKLVYGAKDGEWDGITGRAYGIATKNAILGALPRSKVFANIQRFIDFSHSSDKTFLLTRVGCGYAKYSDVDIAPMFRGIKGNVIVPEEWLKLVSIPGEGFEHPTWKF